MACRTINMLGQKFGHLTVIDSAERQRSGEMWTARWKCRCDCGRIIERNRNHLVKNPKGSTGLTCNDNDCEFYKAALAKRPTTKGVKRCYDWSGRVVGGWKLVEKTSQRCDTYRREHLYRAICPSCNKESLRTVRSLKTLEKRLQKGVKYRGCSNCFICQTASYTKHGRHVSSDYMRQIARSAKKRGIEFKITIEELDDLFDKQGHLCALSGIPIVLTRRISEQRNLPNTASLDRIDSSKGYEIDNVQWVSKNINLAKLKHTNEQFVEMCRLVINRQRKLKRQQDKKGQRSEEYNYDSEGVRWHKEHDDGDSTRS